MKYRPLKYRVIPYGLKGWAVQRSRFGLFWTTRCEAAMFYAYAETYPSREEAISGAKDWAEKHKRSWEIENKRLLHSCSPKIKLGRLP